MKPIALMIDDDETSSRFAVLTLKKLGIDCVSFSTEAAFLEAYERLKPRLCLIDLFIGSATVGFKLIQKIRETDQTTPLFIVSGHSDRMHVSHALEVGANDYLVKPLDPDSLASKLSRHIQAHEVSRSRLPLFPVPKGRTEAIVRLPFRILEIDELGVTLQGPHLPTKGILIAADSMLLAEATGSQSRRLRITQTWVIEGSAEFGAYAEFDSSDPRPLNRKALRVWLKTRR